jgi:hypothetical protein
MAIRGDVAALRICMDRIVPVARHRTVRFSIPTLSSAKDASSAMAAVLAAVAEGILTPDEASELSNLVANFVKTLEVTALEELIEVLEKGSDPGRKFSGEELARELEKHGLPPFVFGVEVPVLDQEGGTEPMLGIGMGNGKADDRGRSIQLRLSDSIKVHV